MNDPIQQVIQHNCPHTSSFFICSPLICTTTHQWKTLHKPFKAQCIAYCNIKLYNVSRCNLTINSDYSSEQHWLAFIMETVLCQKQTFYYINLVNVSLKAHIHKGNCWLPHSNLIMIYEQLIMWYYSNKECQQCLSFHNSFQATQYQFQALLYTGIVWHTFLAAETSALYNFKNKVHYK
jgi:hypothetical protein